MPPSLLLLLRWRIHPCSGWSRNGATAVAGGRGHRYSGRCLDAPGRSRARIATPSANGSAQEPPVGTPPRQACSAWEVYEQISCTAPDRSVVQFEMQHPRRCFAVDYREQREPLSCEQSLGSPSCVLGDAGAGSQCRDTKPTCSDCTAPASWMAQVEVHSRRRGFGPVAMGSFRSGVRRRFHSLDPWSLCVTIVWYTTIVLPNYCIVLL